MKFLPFVTGYRGIEIVSDCLESLLLVDESCQNLPSWMRRRDLSRSGPWVSLEPCGGTCSGSRRCSCCCCCCCCSPRSWSRTSTKRSPSFRCSKLFGTSKKLFIFIFVAGVAGPLFRLPRVRFWNWFPTPGQLLFYIVSKIFSFRTTPMPTPTAASGTDESLRYTELSRRLAAKLFDDSTSFK